MNPKMAFKKNRYTSNGITSPAVSASGSRNSLNSMDFNYQNNTNDTSSKSKNNYYKGNKNSRDNYSTSVKQTSNIPAIKANHCYVCYSCKRPYTCWRNQNVLYGRIPRILPCGHTTCDECIESSSNKIVCALCSKITLKKDIQSLDYNYHIVGQIFCTKSNTSVSLDVDLSLKPVKSSTYNKNCNLHGCVNLGTYSCLDCCNIYCSKCDESLHNSDSHLNLHKRIVIDQASLEIKKCKEHTSMLEDLYCGTCNTICCCYCMLENHEGHNRSYLTRLNDDEKTQLETSYQKVKEKLSELQNTLKKLSHTSDDNNKASNIELDIAQYFNDLHGKLYQIEKKLLTKTRNVTNKHNMSGYKDIVMACIETLKYLIDCVDNHTKKKLNVKDLLCRLKETENMPTYLLHSLVDDKEIKFVVDQVVENIDDFFKVETPIEKSFKFVSADELPEDYSKPIFKETKNPEKKQIVPSNSKRENKKIVKPQNRTNYDSLSQQTVQITYMHSMDCFYVRFKKENDQFFELEKEIEHFVEENPSYVNEIQLNELYLTKNPINKKWARVRILQKTEDDDVYNVTFIDFGNDNIIHKNDLKNSCDNINNKRSFAVCCRIDTSENFTWQENSHLKLQEYLDEEMTILMFIKNFSENIYVVDLNIMTSLGFLCPINELFQDKKPFDMYQNSTEKLIRIYNNSDSFIKEESHDVYMKYVLDPWHVYVLKVSYQNSADDLINSLENYYKDSVCDIHFAFKDSFVVVYHPSKYFGDWHRAKVVDIYFSKKKSLVFLVDWGKQVVVSWRDMRKLVELFQKTECFVIETKLADIAPYSGSWDDKSINYLQKYCKCRSIAFKMLVSNPSPLEIILFEKDVTFDKSINALMVKENLAMSTGPLSEVVMWVHSDELSVPNENEYLSIYKNSSGDESEDDVENLRKTKIDIIRFENPHSIYFTPCYIKEKAERLHEELQIHYSQKKYVPNVWDLHNKVAVFDTRDKLYYRARIEKINDVKYEVYLLDKGDFINVEERHLRILDTYFLDSPNMVLKCNLVNIKPAGDSKKWSSLSIEWFTKLFQKHKNIYIKRIGDDKDKLSMPVAMWYAKITQGTALEPSIYRYISIEKRIIKVGLAFRVNNDLGIFPTKKIESITSKETEIEMETDHVSPTDKSNGIEEINISNWLPAVPLKKDTFLCHIVCADAGGYLFIRDEQTHDCFEEMKKIMKNHFDSIPASPPKKLHKNQLVSIFYDEDGMWYRGEILEVIDRHEVKVLMVDYGSEHIIQIEHLHDRIMYADVPILVNKVKLFNVFCRNKEWSKFETQTFEDISPDYGKIIIKDFSGREPLVVVYSVDGVCLNEELINMCPNLYGLEEKVILENEVNDDVDEGDCDDEVDCGDEINCDIWKLPANGILKAKIVSVYDYETVSFYYNNQSKEVFDTLAEIIQEEAEKQEALTNISIGMPCISRFTLDKKWYRAKIIAIDENFKNVSIMYVDYGNFEIVNISNIKKIKTEWLDILPNYFVGILNYNLIEETKEYCLVKFLEELIENVVTIKIVSENPLRIHIYEDDVMLYYDKFLKDGIIEFKVLDNTQSD